LHQVHHKTCGISYFIFDDIASLAGSADAQNVDPLILSDICEGLKNENPYCTDLHFLGVEARARAEGITTHTNSVSGINMDSEKVEGLCFPLLFPHAEPGYTNASKSLMSPDEYAMSRLLMPEKNRHDFMSAPAPYGPVECVDSHTGEAFALTEEQSEIEEHQVQGASLFLRLSVNRLMLMARLAQYWLMDFIHESLIKE